jgi:hypothetical protein
MFKLVLCFGLTACLIASAAMVVHAQTTQPTGSVALPVMSYLLDNAGGLRPLIGIPGSASIGAALPLNLQVSQAAVPPGHDYILINGDGGVILLNGLTSSPTLQTINGFSNVSNRLAACDALDGVLPVNRKVPTCADRPLANSVVHPVGKIVLSASGSAAALYSESEGRIYSLGNLPLSATVMDSFEISALGSPSAVAISDDGHTVSLGTASGSLFFLTSGQTPQPIRTIHHPSAIRFLSNSTDAIVADDLDNAVYMVSNGQLFGIANADDGISTPVAVALSSDNQRVFVGNSQTGSVTTLHLSGGPAESTICNCSLTGLYPTSTDSLFRLTDYSGGSISLFDSTAMQPRIVYVPAGPRF